MTYYQQGPPQGQAQQGGNRGGFRKPYKKTNPNEVGSAWINLDEQRGQIKLKIQLENEPTLVIFLAQEIQSALQGFINSRAGAVYRISPKQGGPGQGQYGRPQGGFQPPPSGPFIPHAGAPSQTFPQPGPQQFPASPGPQTFPTPG